MKSTQSLKSIWLAWERLRIWYNAILLVEGLIGLAYLRDLGWEVGHLCANVFKMHVLGQAILMVAVSANLFYTMGPLTEILLSAYLKRPLPQLRRYLFIAGTLFSMWIILCLAIRGHVHISGYAR